MFTWWSDEPIVSRLRYYFAALAIFFGVAVSICGAFIGGYRSGIDMYDKKTISFTDIASIYPYPYSNLDQHGVFAKSAYEAYLTSVNFKLKEEELNEKLKEVNTVAEYFDALQVNPLIPAQEYKKEYKQNISILSFFQVIFGTLAVIFSIGNLMFTIRRDYLVQKIKKPKRRAFKSRGVGKPALLLLSF